MSRRFFFGVAIGAVAAISTPLPVAGLMEGEYSVTVITGPAISTWKNQFLTPELINNQMLRVLRHNLVSAKYPIEYDAWIAS